MKTKLTLRLEATLYEYCAAQGAAVVEEVTMPDDQGIVDTLSYQQLPNQKLEWRCYELKVTKADFHSSAKLSFIGNYNYFVLPKKLYEAVKTEIPAKIGVLLYRDYDAQAAELAEQPLPAPGFLTVVKQPRYQDLQVPEPALISNFIAALFREVTKAKRVGKGLALYHSDQLYRELKKRANRGYDIYNPDKNLLDRLAGDLQSEAVTALQTELDARNAQYFELLAKYHALALKEAPESDS